MNPCSPPIAVNRTLKTGSDGKDRHYYSFSGRIGRLHGGVYNKRNKYIRTLPGGSDGGRYCYRNIGKLQCFHRESQKQENFQRFSHCRIGIEWQHRSSLPVYIPENKRKILYIDTEQGRYHCQLVLKRILRLADLPEYKNPDNLIMLALRKFSPKLRLAIVEQAIGTIPDLGLVIIDGIRDFLYDINSSSESTDIISKFMQWTDDRQIHIHTVLHQNKNDEHARGHIGTELNNKAETIMQVEVDKEDKTVSVVEAVHIRDREFEPFAFRINEEAMPEPVESYLPKEKKTGRPTKGPFDPDKEIPKNVHRPALDAVFANGNISNYDDYIERLKEGYGLQGIKLGYNKAVKVATLLSDKQMVIKEGKDYAFNPEYHY